MEEMNFGFEFFRELFPDSQIDVLIANYEEATGETYDIDSLENVVMWIRLAMFDMVMVKLILDGRVLIDWDHEDGQPTFQASEDVGKQMEADPEEFIKGFMDPKENPFEGL